MVENIMAIFEGRDLWKTLSALFLLMRMRIKMILLYNMLKIYERVPDNMEAL